jgi:hypothetical protein
MVTRGSHPPVPPRLSAVVQAPVGHLEIIQDIVLDPHIRLTVETLGWELSNEDGAVDAQELPGIFRPDPG